MPPQNEAPVGDCFDHPVTVADADIDANGHANNVSYIRWVQEAAVAHWYAVVPPAVAAGLSWVVVRHEIDYKRPALRGEQLTVRTWVGEVTAATTERFCEVRRRCDGALLARARTVWCAIDAATGRPKRIGPDIRSLFFGQLPLPEGPAG
jgi:acyl-CoA thioester hydrolase